MASLHLKGFEVQVFLPGWEGRPEPDISASIQSFTEMTAVLRVMGRCCVTEAEVVCVALLGGEKWWLHEVRVVGGQLVYRQAVPG
jgi:hypothetical protein